MKSSTFALLALCFFSVDAAFLNRKGDAAPEGLLQQDADDADDSFLHQVKKAMAKKQPQAPSADDSVDAGEPNAPGSSDEADGSDVLSENEANAQEALLQEDSDWTDDAFMQKAKKAMAKKQPTAPSADDSVDAGEPNAPGSSDEADGSDVLSENEANAQEALLQEDSDWTDDAFMQKAKKAMAKKQPTAPSADDSVDAGEPNAPGSSDEADGSDVLSENEANAQEALLQEDSDWTDDAFMQKAKKAMAKKQPTAPSADDSVDAGEPNAPGSSDEADGSDVLSENEANAQEALLQKDSDWTDDAFMQKAKKAMAKKQPQAPSPDDAVDADEPNAPSASEDAENADVLSENQANAQE